MMKLGHIELFVEDTAISRDFYRDLLGFKVTVEQHPNLVWVEKDNLEILLRKGVPKNSAERYEDASIGFVLYTADMIETVKQLKNQGLIFKGTVDSEKCLTFTDPDGHWFQLVNPEDL